jgi:hypothetical protein
LKFENIAQGLGTAFTHDNIHLITWFAYNIPISSCCWSIYTLWQWEEVGFAVSINFLLEFRSRGNGCWFLENT